MDSGVRARRDGETPNTLSALAALVTTSHQRRGLSAEILRTMRLLAEGRGMNSLVAPVRPTLESAYPLAPFERYVGWKRDDGAPFDPWLRIHWRLGAEFLELMPVSLIAAGTVAEWEEWTGQRKETVWPVLRAQPVNARPGRDRPGPQVSRSFCCACGPAS
jgi:hypothetical protein